jgi:SAM-dependent methyltransferase
MEVDGPRGDPPPGADRRRAANRRAGASAATSFDGWYDALRRAGSAYRRAQEEAFGRGQLVGQQGLRTADEILGLARLLRPGAGGRLVDVCCGPGGPAGLIAARLGCQVVGLDRSAGAIAHASGLGAPGVRLVRADAVCLPFRVGSFRAALVLDSLASILSPAALLGELRRVLAPGGRLGCTVEVGEPLRAAEQGRLPRASTPPSCRWTGGSGCSTKPASGRCARRKRRRAVRRWRGGWCASSRASGRR